MNKNTNENMYNNTHTSNTLTNTSTNISTNTAKNTGADTPTTKKQIFSGNILHESILSELKERFENDSFERNAIVPNWFGTKGRADILYHPSFDDSLQWFLRNKSSDISITVVGGCANTLVSDDGIDGVTVKLTSKHFSKIKFHGGNSGHCVCVEIGAGGLNANVAMHLAKNGLSGLEFLYTVPGTVGGAIKMNAGSFHQETFDTLQWVRVMNLKGEISYISKNDIDYGYRFANINGIVLSAAFELTKCDSEKMISYMKSIIERKSKSQPVREKTGGSTFCNLTANDYSKYGTTARAWELIRKAGFAGYRVGDAYISEKHSNFIINEGDSAENISKLMKNVHDGVLNKFGIDLKTEIKKVGKW